MTKRERVLIYIEVMRHRALSELCAEDDLRGYHEEVAAALLSALEMDETYVSTEKD